jgi:CubicO group peptidase (beta-lactamase class C family)
VPLKSDQIKSIINLTAISLIILFGLMLMTSDGSVIYMARLALWGRTDTGDVHKFAAKSIPNRAPAFHFMEDPTPARFKPISYTWQGKSQSSDLETIMTDSGTTALIIIQDGSIQLEHYYNNASRETINTSFSVANAFTSVLIGIAINEGYIKSIDDPIVDYLPELHGRGLEKVTIRHLLTMSTGIRYLEKDRTAPFIWVSDEIRTYYNPDLRELALRVSASAEPPGTKFLYNNYHPLLEGMILERATGVPVSFYLQEKLWQPLGMEFPATWSVDSKLDAFEKMTSGLNARSIDFAKFGQLMLDYGVWNDTQLIPQSWVKESTAPGNHDPRPWMSFEEYKKNNGYYQYHWWGKINSDGHYEFLAIGSYAQYIYVCPKNRIVIVRNGSREGHVDDWPALLQALEDQLITGVK